MASSTTLAKSRDRYCAVRLDAPYFHNGSATTLMDAVNFYDTRFTLRLSQQDKDDLVAFVKTL
jgi:cytochrome c peroxidase